MLKILIFITLLLLHLPAGAKSLLSPVVIEGQNRLGPSLITIENSEIESQQVPLLIDLLRTIPGLNIFSSGGTGQPTSVFIRGSKSEHLLVLIDGIEMNDPSSPGRGYDFSNLSTDNIESIEIYKGAASSVYGSDALGGVINIKTKSANQTKKTVYLESGSFLSFRSNLNVSGLTNKFNYHVSGSHHQSQGFSAAQAADPKDKDGFNNTSLNLHLSRNLTSMSKLSLSGQFNQFNTDLDYSGNIDDPNFTSKQQQFIIGSNFLTSFLNKNLVLTINMNANISDRTFKNLADSLNPESYKETFKAQNLKSESKLSYQIDKQSSLDFSLHFRNESASSNKILNGTKDSSPKQQQNTLSQSFYYKNSRKNLDLHAGLRHDRFLNLSQSFLNQSISAGYNFENIQSTISFNYSSGIKSPSLFQLYSEFGSEDLNPERSSSYDLSVEKVFLKNSLLTLTYFNTEYKNLIDFDMTNSKYHNIAKALTQGAEIGISYLYLAILKLELSYQYLDTKDRSTSQLLLRRPLHTVKSGLTWTKPRWSLTLNSLFVGQRYDISPTSFQRVLQPSYLLFNTLVRYEILKNLFLNARVENIFDKTYQEVLGYQTSSRAFYLGAQMHF